MKRNLIFTINIISFLSVSCVTSYYTPSAHHVPLFQDKGEFSVQGTVNTNGLLDGEIAYAITNNVAIMGGISLNGSKEISNFEKASGSHLNLAVGYFTPLVGKNTMFQLYGGMERGGYNYSYKTIDRLNFLGNGNYSISYMDVGTANYAFNKFYLMPSFGYTHQIFDFAFSLRMAHLSFAKVENNVTKQNTYAYKTVEGLRDIGNSILFEPAITWRVGWENLKWQTQVGWSVNASNVDPIYFDGLVFSTGLYFIITNRYKKQPILMD